MQIYTRGLMRLRRCSLTFMKKSRNLKLRTEKRRKRRHIVLEKLSCIVQILHERKKTGICEASYLTEMSLSQ
eukprot:10249678-Ditylum_brightwellii.AAC.1